MRVIAFSIVFLSTLECPTSRTVTVQTTSFIPRLTHQLLNNWCAFHKRYDALKYIETSPFYGFYKTHDLTIHLPSGCSPKTSCHFLAIFTESQVLFAYVIAVMDLKVVQE